MKQLIITLIFALGFGVVGVICLFFSKMINNYAISYYENNKRFEALNPFLEWIKSPSYSVSIKMIGVFCILAFAILVMLILKQI